MVRSFSWLLIVIALHICLSFQLTGQDVPFITKWKTEANSTSITIPINTADASLSYKYDVDWDNDGIYDSLGLSGSVTHDYGKEGIFEVAIKGEFPAIYFNNGGDRLKIIDILQWGNIKWENMNSAFDGCSNLIYSAEDAPCLDDVGSMSEMFRRASNFNGDLSSWDVSNVPWMVSTFQDASSFNGDITTWDVSNCNSIRYMFDGASSFNQDISCWIVDQMVDFRYTFRDASSFDQNLAKWNISNATNLTGFLDNSGISRSNYDNTLIGWSNLSMIPEDLTLGADGLEYCNGASARQELMSAPFDWNIIGDAEYCNGAYFITTWLPDSNSTPAYSFSIPTHPNKSYNYDIDIGNDGTFEYKDESGDVLLTFMNASEVTIAIKGEFPHFFLNKNIDRKRIISLDQWGEIRWTSMDSAFWRADAMMYNADDAPDLTDVESMKRAFSECELFQGDLNAWDVSNVKSMESMFARSDSLDVNISEWDVGNVSNFRGTFASTFIFNSDLSRWDVRNATDMGSMFENAEKFNSDISLWEVGNVVDMSRMFRDTEAFTSDLNDWDVSNVEKVELMFSCAKEFNSDLDMWGPRLTKVRRTDRMFSCASKFNGRVDNWNLEMAICLNGMFSGASLFNQDISSWNTSNIQEMENMFQGADAFDQDIGDLDISEVRDMNFIFSNSGMSRESYDSTLIKWANKDVRYNVRIGAIGVNYCEGKVARDTLDLKYNWNFRGDIYDCNALTCTEITNTKYSSSGLGEWADSPENNWDKKVVPDSCHRVILQTRTIIPQGYDANCYTIEMYPSVWGVTIDSGATLTVHVNGNN